MKSGIQNLIEIVQRLRDPREGCPWDLEQNHLSLLPYFFEELHEFAEVLKAEGPASEKTQEELGDVLYQIILHTQLMAEKGLSSFDEIAQRCAEKLVLRHPHVFDPAFPKFKSAAEVNAAWERIKAYAREKSRSKGNSQSLAAQSHSKAPRPSLPAFEQVSAVPASLPALQRASRIGEKAAGFRFDWARAEDVFAKVEEELQELKADQQDNTRAHEELGDLLFALAQYARKRGWDPEQVLDSANHKFLKRFQALEEEIQKEGKSMEKCHIDELEEAWSRIKSRS